MTCQWNTWCQSQATRNRCQTTHNRCQTTHNRCQTTHRYLWYCILLYLFLLLYYSTVVYSYYSTVVQCVDSLHYNSRSKLQQSNTVVETNIAEYSTINTCVQSGTCCEQSGTCCGLFGSGTRYSMGRSQGDSCRMSRVHIYQFCARNTKKCT